MIRSCTRPLWKCLFNFILQNCKNTVGACLPDGVFYLLPLFCTAVLALLSHTKTGDKMKKCVRAATAVLAVVLAVIYGLVGFGCWALPDTVRTGGGDAPQVAADRTAASTLEIRAFHDQSCHSSSYSQNSRARCSNETRPLAFFTLMTLCARQRRRSSSLNWYGCKR